MKHLEVDGISWCQCVVAAQLISEAARKRIVLVCQEDDDVIDASAQWLQERGIKATATPGPCQQRSPYPEES